MPDKHCLLSASSSHRFLNCEKSVSLTEGLPDGSTVYSQAGTLAHTCCQISLCKALNLAGKDEEYPAEATPEMMENAKEYTQFVVEYVQEYQKEGKHPKVYVEQEMSYSDFIPDSFGTSDTVILTDDLVHIIDYKNGAVPVEVESNSQLMIYGLAALQTFDNLYDFKKVRLSIFQPNISNYGTWEISKEDLIAWGLNVLKPAGERILNNHDLSWKSGDWCRWCKIKSSCRKRAEENMCLAAYDFALPETLTPEEIGKILSQIEQLVSWSNDVKDYALTQALQGVRFEGWKLVAGRSNRKYSDEEAVANAVQAIGIDPFEKRLLTITDLQKKMGKAKFEEVVGQYIVKPEGKPTLVVETDKRPELEVNSAINDFKNIDNTEE